MARNVVFLIHGIGRHGATWATDPGGPVETLETAARQYDALKNQDIATLIDFVPIRYDDIFDRILAQWQSLADGLGQAEQLLGGALADAVDVLHGAGDDTNKFITFGGDVVLYRGFRLFAQRVQMRVIRTIAETVADRLDTVTTTVPRMIVVAHSLGTTVAHDALNLLATAKWTQTQDRWPEDKAAADADRAGATTAAGDVAGRLNSPNGFAPDRLQFECVFMIANTSNLLHTTAGAPADTIVRPEIPGSVDGYCEHFYNVAHVLDPVPAVAPFRMPASWNTPRESGLDIRVNHVYERDIHDFGHYLMHPAVHSRILYYALEGWHPTAADMQRMNNFPQTTPQILAKKAEIEAAWRGLGAGGVNRGSLRAFAALLREMNVAVEAL